MGSTHKFATAGSTPAFHIARLFALAALIFVCTATAATTASRAAPNEVSLRLPGHVLPALAGATATTTADSTAPLTLTVVLNRDDEAGFQQYLHDVYDPASPNFRHFLTPAQIAERFGPSQQDYDEVLTYLSAQNFALIEGSSNRMTLTVNAARTDIEQTFSIHIGDYRLGERSFFANDADPALPAEIAPHVQAIAGLSDFAQPHSLFQATPNPADFQCPDGVSPERCNLYGPLCEIYSASRATGEFLQKLEGGNEIKDIVESTNSYNENLATYYKNCLNNNFTDSVQPKFNAATAGTGVPWLSVDGSGQAIGLVEFDQYQTSDIVNYLNFTGAPATEINNLSEVSVGAGASFGTAEDEVVLDIDTAMSLAPNAKVIVYSAAFPGAGTSFQAVFNKMLSDGLVTIISNSWAYCEDQTALADVTSIDSILQTAAAAGISVFSGSGDSGSTCLDGAANTVAVPADSPNLTAVGGTSLNSGAGGVYVGETWWNGSAASPQTGQGGFGVSRFFTKPVYQTGLTSSTMRSVPDVSVVADPADGIQICQADAGGCPTGLFYGGTSMATPIWAAFTALLNQVRGSNLGLINSQVYPLAATTGFHNPASMGSDFAHVGLGSPNLNALSLLLSGQTAGLPDANVSGVLPLAPPEVVYGNGTGVPADGSTAGVVVVKLRDANGNTVSGKTVSLSANAGNHATISSPNGTTSSPNDGTVVFTITDLTAETLTFTAKDTTDTITLAQQPTLPFVGAAATQGGIVASPTMQTADGVNTSTITVTLEDALIRPSSGKQVLLSQNGNSVILGANPGTTGSNGEAQFDVTDQVQETVVYTAIDATDNNLPVPGTASVAFSGAVANSCGTGSVPVAGPGYAIGVYANGFAVQNDVNYGGITLEGCVGVGGIAFDGSGNLFVSDYVTGDVYKFAPGGGIAGSSSKITTAPIGQSLGPLSFSDGTLYGVILATTNTAGTGAVLKIDQATGAATAVASNLTCPLNLATDPLSNDLFVSDGCYGSGASASILRVPVASDPSQQPSTYAISTGSPNGSLSFAPDGTLYVVYEYNNPFAAGIDQISGTNGPATPTVQSTGATSSYSALAIGSNPAGGAQSLIVGAVNTGGLTNSTAAFDMTITPPAFSGATLVTADVGGTKILGPDNCVYLGNSNVVYKLTNADGSCPLTGLAPNPSIVLSTSNVGPAVAAQGSSIRFNVSFPHNPDLPFGTPVTYSVSGANSLQGTVYVGFGSDTVSFAYTGVESGTDSVVAYAQINGAIVASNALPATWTPGKHTTYLNLNSSVTSASIGSSATVSATLTDLSANPATAISGATVQFTLAGQSCSTTTNANGSATCTIAVSALTQCTLTATYAGNSQYLSTTASELFSVSSYDVIFSNGFEAPLQGGSCILYN